MKARQYQPASGSVVGKSIFLCVMLASLVAVPAFSLSEGRALIQNGESVERTFTVEDPARPVVLLLRGRIVLPDGENSGAHCLRITLNDVVLDEEGVKVLNKAEMHDRPSAGSDHPSGTAAAPLFDPESGAWYLKADSDYVPFNDTNPESAYHSPDALTGGSWWHNRYRARGAFESHYYEYCIELPAEHVRDRNVLELGARLPEHYGDRELEVDGPYVFPADGDVVVYRRNWEDTVFSWQAPGVEDLLEGDEAVRVAGAPGEWRPATLSIYALRDLEAVTADLPFLEQVDGAGRIGPGGINVFRVDTLERSHLAGAGFISTLPFVPEAESKGSPELLRPLKEPSYGFPEVAEAQVVPQYRTQRFYIDVKIPSDAQAGSYRGIVRVSSAGETVAEVPLEIGVYPFDLAEPRQTYWMWRLTWTPLWEPANVRNLEKIREAGFDGMTLPRGPGFKFNIDEEGEIQVDGTGYRRQVKTLREAGLTPTLRAHFNAPLKAALRAAGVQGLGRPEDFITKFWVYVDEVGIPMHDRFLGTDEVGAASGELPEEMAEALPEGKTPEDVLAEVEGHLTNALRQVRQIAEEEDATLYAFPVDEPCGTAWRRGWTRFLSARAHEAGLKTWSTRNNFDWDAELDHGACGGKINGMYQRPQVLTEAYEGRLEVHPWPVIGAATPDAGAYEAQWHDAGGGVRFKGLIDEVRIYNRPLSLEEVKRQHEDPAPEGLIAYYPFEQTADGRVPDASGHGSHAVITGTPGLEDGVVGKAMKFDGKNDHIDTFAHGGDAELDGGYSISMWYRGRGSLFGRREDWRFGFFRAGNTPRFRYRPEGAEPKWFNVGGWQTTRFWQHVTLVFDTEQGLVRSYAWDDGGREWYRDNVRSNYMQVRSMPPNNFRPKMGLMAWSYYGMEEITAFCYDWNFNHLYSVYPKDGKRGADTWYATLGWRGTREGIDDARYLRTLERLFVDKRGMDGPAARRAVEETLGEIDEPSSYGNINRVPEYHGSFDAMRRRVAERIMELIEE